MLTLKIEDKIVSLRGEPVLIDTDVAELYGVETKRVNEAVKNNPDKFPDGYLLSLSKADKNELVENFDRFNRLKHSTAQPTAFTEKGLYMLATILKSPTATQTTLGIIETFAKVRELSRHIGQMARTTDPGRQKNMMQKSGELISDILGEDFQTTGTETTIEFNLAVLKVTHKIKKEPHKN